MLNFKEDSDKPNSNLENLNPACMGLAPYPRQPYRWKIFEKIWFEEDKANLESILKKVKVNVDKKIDLNNSLTKQEIAWTTGFAVRAVLWDFYWKSID